jgi:hypothetical protein
VRAGQVLDGNAPHRDLLHELLVVGIDRVEPVHLGAFDLVGRRVSQGISGVERPKCLQRLGRLLRITFDLLRLVDDEDRSVGSDDIDGPAGLEVVEHFVDPTGVLAGGIERLDVDDHHLHACVG